MWILKLHEWATKSKGRLIPKAVFKICLRMVTMGGAELGPVQARRRVFHLADIQINNGTKSTIGCFEPKVSNAAERMNGSEALKVGIGSGDNGPNQTSSDYSNLSIATSTATIRCNR